MSHACGRASSAKDKASNVFYRKIKPPMKDALTRSKVDADCKCGKCRKSDGQHKMKKLRTRKERDQLRDGGKEVSKAKSYHPSYSHPFSKDVSHQCCHNTSTTGRFPNVVTHEPSVITDSRLIGHHGLFNHEVKSIDIERLLSEQRKLDRNEKLAENRNSRSHISAFAANPPSNERQCMLDSSEEAGRFKKKNLPTTKTLIQSQEQENKTMESNSQCSDLTPGQRLRKTQTLTETNINDESSKCSSSDAVVSQVRKVQPALFENSSESHQTPSSFNKNNALPGSVASVIGHTAKKPASAAKPSQASHPSPQLPSNPTVAEASNNLDTQGDSLVSYSTAMSVKAIAASLCNNVSFSLLRKRNLVAESRDTLLKALRQRHGPQLQRNLLKIKQQLCSYGCEEGQGEASEPCHIMEFADEEGPITADEFTTQATRFATSSFTKTESVHFDWNSTDWSNPLDTTADWLGIPAESPIVLDDSFSRRCSPLFPVDFELKNSREREHLFPPSPSSFVDAPRSSGHVEDFFISAKGKESAMTDSTKNDMCFSDMRTLGYRKSPRTSVVNDHYSFDSRRSGSVRFPQVHSSFERSHKYSYGKSFSEDIPYFQQNSSRFSHSSLPSASPVLSNSHINIADYPPSYMVERDPSLSTGSGVPSPGHWSFPPMRLY